MVCPNCGLCDTFAVGYPVVDLTSIESQYPHRPLRPEEFASLVPLLRPLIPSHLPVRHGQSLGPMTGEAKGTLGDVVPVIGDGATCVRADKFVELRTAGLSSLIGVPVKVKYRKEPGIQIVELQVDGLVRLASPSFPPEGLQECDICGRNNLDNFYDSQVTIRRSSIPSTGCVFGLFEWNKGLIVNEKFAEIAKKVLSNAEFVEIPVIDE